MKEEKEEKGAPSPYERHLKILKLLLIGVGLNALLVALNIVIFATRHRAVDNEKARCEKLDELNARVQEVTQNLDKVSKSIATTKQMEDDFSNELQTPVRSIGTQLEEIEKFLKEMKKSPGE